MKIRKNDNTREPGNRAKLQNDQSNFKSVPLSMEGSKRHSSLVARISSFYTGMLASWLSISLAVVFLLVIVFNVAYAVFEINPYINELESYNDANSMIDKINTTQEVNLVLLDEQNTIIASSFKEIANVLHYDFSAVDPLNKKVYAIYSRKYYVNGQSLTLNIYYDITLILIEILGIGSAAILIYFISIITVYIRGNYFTRKAFRVLDELIVKASNISSQNLNLRLNVSDSTDELVEFAMTFNRMMDRIEKAYEKQNQFVSDASHELRTPIAVIQGYARMLERWGKDDKEILQESISAINKEAKAMQDLVEKLLFIARNDKDTLVLIKDKFDMSELMNELVRDTIMLGTQHEIQSFIEPGITIFGDRDRIKQALRIFVDNALKYTEPGGKITLKLVMEDGYAVAVIKDTGIGIPEKDLPKIFDRFYRVDAAREREKGGHGLGLSIARIIVLRHGGRITVASKVGKGTRFSVYLPV